MIRKINFKDKERFDDFPKDFLLFYALYIIYIISYVIYIILKYDSGMQAIYI